MNLNKINDQSYKLKLLVEDEKNPYDIELTTDYIFNKNVYNSINIIINGIIYRKHNNKKIIKLTINKPFYYGEYPQFFTSIFSYNTIDTLLYKLFYILGFKGIDNKDYYYKYAADICQHIIKWLSEIGFIEDIYKFKLLTTDISELNTIDILNGLIIKPTSLPYGDINYIKKWPNILKLYNSYIFVDINIFKNFKIVEQYIKTIIDKYTLVYLPSPKTVLKRIISQLFHILDNQDNLPKIFNNILLKKDLKNIFKLLPKSSEVIIKIYTSIIINEQPKILSDEKFVVELLLKNFSIFKLLPSNIKTTSLFIKFFNKDKSEWKFQKLILWYYNKYKTKLKKFNELCLDLIDLTCINYISHIPMNVELAKEFINKYPNSAKYIHTRYYISDLILIEKIIQNSEYIAMLPIEQLPKKYWKPIVEKDPYCFSKIKHLADKKLSRDFIKLDINNIRYVDPKFIKSSDYLELAKINNDALRLAIKNNIYEMKILKQIIKINPKSIFEIIYYNNDLTLKFQLIKEALKYIPDELTDKLRDSYKPILGLK